MSDTAVVPVLYEDSHLLVVVKPVGWPVQADRSGAPDLLSYLKADIKQRYHKPGNVFLGLVHRLDRPVGGVMVFARTSKAASRLSAEIRERRLEKIYLARVRGRPEPPSMRLVHYLRKDSARNVVAIVDANESQGQEAMLDYEVLATAGPISEVCIRLHTGRPHQIRVQLAAIGCPLLGDCKYGGDAGRDTNQAGPALWSHALRFKHPTQDRTIECRAPAPWPSLAGAGKESGHCRSGQSQIKESDET